MENRVIVALDFSDMRMMSDMVDMLGDTGEFYKVGMELFYTAGVAPIAYLKERNKRVFLDLKLYDIPNTVAKSVSVLTRLGVDLITVHAQGGRAMMRAAADAATGTAAALGLKRPKIVAVTALTSFDNIGWQEIGGHLPIEDAVTDLASLAISSGMDGVVASPQEIVALREIIGDEALIVTPGVRPVGTMAGDQKRTATPREALEHGVSYLVIGRPITQANDPQAALEMVLSETEGV